MKYNDIVKIHSEGLDTNIIDKSDILSESVEIWDCTIFDYFRNGGKSDSSIADKGYFHSDRVSCDDLSRNDGLLRALL